MAYMSTLLIRQLVIAFTMGEGSYAHPFLLLGRCLSLALYRWIKLDKNGVDSSKESTLV